MANIKELIESIESTDSSFDDKLEAITKMEETLVAMRQQEEQAINDNVELIVEAIKVMENKVSAQLEIAKSIVPEKGDKGDKGADGKQGKNGRDGKDGKDGLNGKDGQDGQDGVSVRDAKIDFDGSLVITLSTGQELNVGEVVAPDLAEKIKVISTMSTNGAVAIKDEGTSITSGVKTINFVGATVTATNSGDDVTVNVSAGTGTVTSVAATAGTGISITGSPITTTGTLNITNTAPDQTVSLTASTGISTSGTYPNFTITNSAPDQTVALTAGTGISTSGTYPNFTITNSAPDQTVSLTGAGTTSITGTYPNFTITSNDSATGTVTSVGLSGGTTGLTVTGSPITTSGTITLGGTLDVDNGGTGQTSYTDGQLLIGNTTGNTLTKATLTAGSGIAITNGGGSISIAATNSGTVTSVTGTSPVVSSGGTTPAISLASGYGDTQNPYASKTANHVLAAPDGSAGVPTFRAVVAADIPTLNQNTTGTASNVTGIVAVANGGTGTATPSLVAGTNITISGSFPNQTINSTASGSGTVTSVAATVPSFLSVSGSPITTSGTLAIALASTPTNGQLLIGNGTGFSYANLTAGSNITITNSAGGITIASSGGGGGSSLPITKMQAQSFGGF